MHTEKHVTNFKRRGNTLATTRWRFQDATAYSNDYLFWKHCRAVLTVVAGCPALKKCIRTFLCLHFKMPAQLCHHFFFWGEINDRKGWVFLQNENAVANVIPSLTNVLFTSNLSQDPSHKNRSHCGKGINGFFLY